MAPRGVDQQALASLRAHAKCAADHNYARYSGYLVVAAVETTDGQFFGGTNIEVANYSLTKHAEEMAIMLALATRALRRRNPERDRWLKTLYVCGAAPCGSCRQFAWEWAATGAHCVIDLPKEDRYRVLRLERLLPDAFGPADVKVDRRPARPAGGRLPP